MKLPEGMQRFYRTMLNPGRKGYVRHSTDRRTIAIVVDQATPDTNIPYLNNHTGLMIYWFRLLNDNTIRGTVINEYSEEYNCKGGYELHPFPLTWPK